jgi:cell division protein FtsN
MVMKRALAGICFALLLGLSGCSRQQSDWEKTRAANTTDAYEQFLKRYPSGEFTAQAQARVKELYEERDWQKARDADTQEAYQAFLKQYPEGKWTEEARIRVENFSLAQAPTNGSPAAPDGANAPGNSGAAESPAAPPAARPEAPQAAAPQAAAPQRSTSPPRSPPPSTAAPGPAPAAGTTRTPASAPKSKPAPGGAYGIQLGAFKSSADAARKRWAHLEKEFPRLLSGMSPTVTAKKSDSGTLYRLQVVGLTENHARALCKTLKAKSQACVLVHPGALQ